MTDAIEWLQAPRCAPTWLYVVVWLHVVCSCAWIVRELMRRGKS